MSEEREPETIKNTATQENDNSQASSGALDSETRNWGMACHFASFSGFVIPFFSFLGPLIIWLIKKDEMAYVDHHGKESLNFQITILLAYIACFVLTFFIIGIFLFFAVFIFWLIMTVVAGVKASSGEYYRYPLCLRLIK
jgi:uncharacterized Tic20 family protein